MKKEVVGNVPGNVLGMIADLAHKLQHGVITESQLGKFLQKQNPFDAALGSAENQLESWRQLYLDEFGIELGEVEIPKQRPSFDRLIVVAKGTTAQQGYDQCQKHFNCWKYTDRDLDEAVPTNDRAANEKSYAVWVRERVEADDEFKNLSTNQLKKKKHQGITLTERLLYELKYFLETGKHLDIKNINLCTGSRSGHGGVPYVRWLPGTRKMSVHWYGPGSAGGNLCSREAVS